MIDFTRMCSPMEEKTENNYLTDKIAREILVGGRFYYLMYTTII